MRLCPRCDRADEGCRINAPVLTRGTAQALVACHHPLLDTPLERRPLLTSVADQRHEEPILVGSAIDAHYGAHQVLFDVGFAIQPRQCTAIVGQSGSGKTTLARALGGLGASLGGELALGGTPIGIGSAPGPRICAAASSISSRTPIAR
jgi:peptide/nickel transport system ATP-binding protein